MRTQTKDIRLYTVTRKSSRSLQLAFGYTEDEEIHWVGETNREGSLLFSIRTFCSRFWYP